MTSIDVIPATAELMRRFYGRTPARTSQAVVAVQGERVLGVAGIYLVNGHAVAFTELSDEIRSNKRLIVRGYRALLPFIRAAGLPVLALCDASIDGSERLLEHYDFKPMTQGVWQWQG
jgi:hypothetical protein